MCKDCGRTFYALTGTPLAQLHRRDAGLAYAKAQPQEGRRALRDCARDGVPLRHSLLEAALAGEMFILKSQKAARKISGRAPRNGGGQAKSRACRPTSTTAS